MVAARLPKNGFLLFVVLAVLCIPSQGLTLNVLLNGADGLLEIEQGTNLSMSINLDPQSQVGNNADIWMKVIIPQSAVYYLTPGFTWNTTITPVYQGTLVNLNNYFVATFPTSTLPLGTYVFVFGVDNNMDGSPDFHHADTTRVTLSGIRPSFSIEGGPYLRTQSVKVSCTTPGSTLFYTLNGQDPTQSSTPITNGSFLTIGPGITILRVRAFKSGWTDGAIKTAIYQIGPKVAAQASHSLALDTLGNLSAFGSNSHGELGLGQSGNSLSYPVTLSNPANVSMLAVRSNGSSLVLKSDSTVWSWGNNSFYQNGYSPNVDRATPDQITGLGSIKYVAAGYFHGLAVKRDSTLWAWGDNSYGQLGDSTDTARSAPTRVKALQSVMTVAAGRDFSMALKMDGSLWTWGNNDLGQLGNGENTPSFFPIRIPSLT
ncbi:MAG TPA: chitobiase/beta-hexosaminidase C-terminal domain-containing protein, partial [Fibrobacteria bacterium]|nr:chitobiase/beta-hexosaminidase C-terminal domain-containing protein [Fibrobacteria bacterium]